MQTLTRGQKIVLGAATLPMIAAGVAGAWGTYDNIVSVLHRHGTAAGVVAAGEGAVLVLALVYVGLTMLGQAAPRTVRAGLWLLPAAASTTGLVIAPTTREAVVFAITPMAMTVSAEGLGLLARRIVVHATGRDTEAQRRNAATLRRIAYLRARSLHHPWRIVRKWSALRAWRLMAHVGEGDMRLGDGLTTVMRERLTEGAGEALGDMLGPQTAAGELPPVEPVSPPPVSREPMSREPVEPEPSPETAGFDEAVQTALNVAAPARAREPQPLPLLAHQTDDLPVRGEPVSPLTEPAPTASDAPAPAVVNEPHIDEQERQICELVSRLKEGERLTKNTAALLLGVSPATAGRRLRAARERLNAGTEGTGMYL